jgi:hypothetical protein
MTNFYLEGFWIYSIVSLNLKNRYKPHRIIINSEIQRCPICFRIPEHDPPQEQSITLWKISECKIKHIRVIFPFNQIFPGRIIHQQPRFLPLLINNHMYPLYHRIVILLFNLIVLV